jgi:hypothetical protein
MYVLQNYNNSLDNNDKCMETTDYLQMKKKIYHKQRSENGKCSEEFSSLMVLHLG